MACALPSRQLIKELHAHIYDEVGALTTVFGLRISATSRSLGCSLCKASIKDPFPNRKS